MFKNNIDLLLHNPALMQDALLLEMEKRSGITFLEPSNPVVMLAEAFISAQTAAIDESVRLLAKTHPSLCLNTKELLNHMTPSEQIGIHATPSSGVFKFMVSISDMLKFGTVIENGVTVTIESGTLIEFSGTSVMAENDIIITLTNNVPFVTLSNSSGRLGNIESSITTTTDGIDRIIFDITLRQLKAYYGRYEIVGNESMSVDIPINKDRFNNLDIGYVLNGETIPINVVYGDEIFDRTIPTAIVKISDVGITITIDKLYIENGLISTEILYSVYVTSGQTNIDLSTLTINDFVYVHPKSFSTVNGMAMKNISVFVAGIGFLAGGQNQKTFSTLKESVIMRTTGQIKYPITRQQLTEFGLKNDFELSLLTDSLFRRIFLAKRQILSVFNDQETKSNMDVYACNLELNDVNMSNSINIKIHNKDTLTLMSGLLCHIVNNTLTPIDDSRMAVINGMSVSEYNNEVKLNGIMETCFYYSITNKSGMDNCQAYDLDSPKIQSISLNSKNVTTTLNVNISRCSVEKIDKGFKISAMLLGNQEYTTNKPVSFFVKLTMESLNGENIEYILEYNPLTGLYETDVITSYLLDRNGIEVTNSISNISSPFLTLLNNADAIIYSTDAIVNDSQPYDITAILNIGGMSAITSQTIVFKFGEQLDNLWTDISSIANSKYYKRHTANKIKTYNRDVYMSELTGKTLDIITPNGDIYDKIAYRKGTLVYDGNVPVYEYLEGDIIYDNNGNPIVDHILGLNRTIGVVAMEHIYRRAGKQHITHANKAKKLIVDWTTFNISDMNNMLLENTSIVYKPSKTLLYDSNGISSGIKKAIISPEVILYVKSGFVAPKDIQKNIGLEIHKAFMQSTIHINEIEISIAKVLGDDVISSQISIPELNNKKIILNTNGTLSMVKYINTNLNVSYDVKITTIKVT